MTPFPEAARCSPSTPCEQKTQCSNRCVCDESLLTPPLVRCQVAGLRPVSLVYVESAARVQKLSLTALILFHLRIADQMFVQWPELQKKYPGTHYVGRLM